MKFLKVPFFILCATLSCQSFASTERQELLARLMPQAHQRLFRNLRGRPMNPTYEFDVLRSPEQALEEGLGGHCNTHARVAAYTLMQHGVPAEDLRIVSAVNDSSYDSLCYGLAGRSARWSNDGMSGHVLLLMRDGAQWFLINTTTIPGTPPGNSYGDERGLEVVPFVDAAHLESAVSTTAIAIPGDALRSLPPFFSSMTIFQVLRPDAFVTHDFEQRRNLIASGQMDSDVCRYDASASSVE